MAQLTDLLNMAVGDTRTLQALGVDGKEVTGQTWSTSDATVVSLSADDPPVLTALAAGHLTIKAGSASADVTVWAGALPVGTAVWSNPGNGSGVQSIVPAVPSANGVADVFAFQNDGTVQAITADGTTAWTADVSQAMNVWPWPILPDFQGGLVVAGNGSIWRLDGITGTPYGTYSCGAGFGCGGRMAVHTDGTVFAIRGTGEPGTLAVVGIDPTGAEKFRVPLQIPAGPLVDGMGSLGLIIAGDGYAYVPYGWLQYVADSSSRTGNLRMLRVGSDGSSQEVPIYQWTFPDIEEGPLVVRGLITNADQGIVMTFGTGETGGGYEWMVTVTGGSTNMTQLSQDLTPVLQAQDGSFVGADDMGNMVGFDAGGNILWSVPNEWPAIATADGGVIGESGTMYDANGMATGAVGPLPTYSWFGDSYQVGSVDQVRAPWLNVAASFWPFSDANRSKNQAAVSQEWFPQFAVCTTTPGCIGPKEAIYGALGDLVARLRSSAVVDGAGDTVASLAQSKVFDKLGTDSSGNKWTTARFVTYLTTHRPGFYDGLRSNYCEEALESGRLGNAVVNALCYGPTPNWILRSVQYYLATMHPTSDAIAATPHDPLLAFFRPSSILYPSLGKNLGNEGMIFHEALHGLTGLDDVPILTALKYDSSAASCNISRYIENNVLSQSPGLDPTSTTPTGCQ